MEIPNLVGQVIDGYTLERRIGSGGFGTVYLGVKEDLGKRYLTAIKHIIVPESDQYEEMLQQYNYDKTLTEKYFTKMVEDITTEFNLMIDLNKKDNRHIVTYYDHTIQKTDSPLQYDIFIRMEYLIPLPKFMKKNGMRVADVVQLGMDMCDALALCHGNDTMHRDIKEANIFMSSNGAFKLGDFGVAKTLIEVTKAASMKGTASYMAPEIHKRQPYDYTVDIYSLGIVLYKLLNNQRMPFMPDFPKPITADDIYQGDTKRLAGEVPPLPCNAADELGDIVVHACAPKESRFSNVNEMKARLDAYSSKLTDGEKNRVLIAPVENYEEETPREFKPSSVPSGREVNPFAPEDSLTRATMKMPNSGELSLNGGNGTPVAPKNKGISTKIKVLVPLCLVVIAAIVVGGIILVQKLNDPVAAFKQQFENADYTQAQSLVDTKITDNAKDMDATISYLKDQAQAAVDGFVGQTMDYDAALAKLNQIQKFKIVDDSDITAYLNQLNSLQTSRDAYATALSDEQTSNFADAINKLQQVIQSDSNYSDAQQRLVADVKAYKDGILNQVSGMTDLSNYSQAVSLLTQALGVIPNDADLSNQLDDFNQKVAAQVKADLDKQIQDAVALATDNQDFTTAISTLNTLLSQNPDDQDITSAIQNVQNSQVTSIISQAATQTASGNFDDAVKTIKNGLTLYADNVALKNALADTQTKQVNSIITQANGLIDDNQFSDAIAALNTGLKSYPNNADLKSAVADAQGKMVDYILAQADTMIQQGNLDDATTLVNHALTLAPGNSDLQSEIDKIDNAKPISIFTLTPLNQYGWGQSNGVLQDSLGNNYSVTMPYLVSGGCYGEFYVNGAYSTIQGTVVPYTGFSQNAKTQLRVYADDVLIYSSPDVGQKTLKFNFKVNITGAQFIKVEVTRTASSYDNNSLLVMDMALLP